MNTKHLICLLILTLTVKISWAHSAKGMDWFVLQYSSNQVEWSEILLKIDELQYYEQDGQHVWSVEVKVPTDDVNAVKWWRIHAETSHGIRSEQSKPVKLKMISPRDLQVRI